MITSGTRLLTKDGRKLGNAIVIHEYIVDDTQYEGKEPEPKIWVIETDFGNIIRMNENQINDLWYINEPCEIEIMMGEEGGGNLQRWMLDRERLITKKAFITPLPPYNETFNLSALAIQGDGTFFPKHLGVANDRSTAIAWANANGYVVVDNDYVRAVMEKQ